MNKKFLSAILFGALMVTSTGTFVSCKDYDEDIENLQTQIDKLATKDELSSQIASLQSALSTAQAAATAAQTEAAKALAAANAAAGTADAADKAAAQAALAAAQAASDAATAKVEAIAAAKAEVAAAKAALEEAVDGKFETLQAELSTTVAELTTKVEELTGLTTEMLTSISLQYGYENGTYDQWYGNSSISIYYNLITKQAAWGDSKSYVFGKGLEGELTLKENQRISKSTSFLIAVSPANAVVTSDMLSLINSKNESLDAYVKLSVEKYEGLITRAAGTGLYKVTATLKNDADLKKFAKATAFDNGQHVQFAVAATKDDRTVATTYSLSVYANEWTDGICGLAYNSYIESTVKSKSLLGDYGQWYEGTSTNDEWCFPVALGEDFTISVNPECGAVLASYVEVDATNSHLSTTDKAALKGVTVTGVNKVSDTGLFTLSINGANAKGVVVPLKVHAIGYNGVPTSTIVWVKAGNSTAVTQTAAYVVTPTKYEGNPTQYVFSGKQAFTVPAGATRFELNVYAKNEISVADQAGLYNSSVLKFFKADGKTPATKVADIAVAQLTCTVDLQAMVDDKVYEGTVKFYNNENTFMGQNAITIQKVLPKAAPEGFSIKTNQVVNGIYNCYLEPNNWNAEQATAGEMAMSQIFNFAVAPVNYQVKFANTAPDNDGKFTKTRTVTGDSKVVVDKSLIDNKSEHATTVDYNYGLISSVKDADGAYVAHKINVAEFVTIYNCIYNTTYSFDWATRAQLGAPYTTMKDGAYTHALPYKTAVTYGATDFTVNTAHIFGTSAWDSKYSKFLSANASLTIKEVALTSNANGEEEYFDVTINGSMLEFAPKSGATNPTAAVPSTLTIKCVDMYNCPIVITLDITVNKR